MLNKDLVAASFTPIILSILSKGESYGYKIIQQLREFSDEQIIWSDGMLYPLLHRLGKKGVITSEWRVSDPGRKRKYYQINEEGISALHKKSFNGIW